MPSNRLGYRDAVQIIQSILECVLKARPESALKTHILQYANLKSSMAEKYLAKMVDAGYLTATQVNWGDRVVFQYEVTEKGVERYKWFLQINSEMNL